jgi:polyribonucleotide nucleotidyltransferase
MKINPEKIRDVIGKGGSIIRALTEETSTNVDISEAGVVTISGLSAQSIEQAKARIQGLAAEVEVGQVYTGKVEKILNFGATVRILPNRKGLLHISKVAKTRVENVSDHLHEGQVIKVRVTKIDEEGRVQLSAEALLVEEEQPPTTESPADKAVMGG